MRSGVLICFDALWSVLVVWACAGVIDAAVNPVSGSLGIVVLAGATCAMLALASFGAWRNASGERVPTRLTRRAATLTVCMGALAAEGLHSGGLLELLVIAIGGFCLWGAWASTRTLGAGLDANPGAVVLVANSSEIARAADVLERERVRVACIVGIDPCMTFAEAFSSVSTATSKHNAALPVLLASSDGVLSSESATKLAKALPEALLLPFGSDGLAATLAMPARVGSLPAVRWSRTPQSKIALAVKRATDVVVAAVLLLITSPLLAGAAIAVALSERAPVLFRQERVGLHGRRFTCIKLRTLPVGLIPDDGDGDDADAALPDVWKAAGVAQASPLGRFLRRFAIDELPQLVNVLRGDMSLVGPRPLPICEAALLTEEQDERHAVRPGLTGTWQVYGRSLVNWSERLEMDRAYVMHWNLRQDIGLLLRTPAAVLRGTGAR